MDFFEVLLILVFIVVPLLEGVFRQRKKAEEPRTTPAPRERERVGAGAGAGREAGHESRGGFPPEREEPAPATDMIPPDLWEVLTGEKRPGTATAPPPWETEEEEFGVEAMSRELGGEGVADQEIGGDDLTASDPWISAPWEEGRTAESERTESLSLEYVGPEAITLETAPLAPEARHRRFHEKYDPEPAPPPSRPSPARTLWSGLEGGGLRRSVLLAEVLGPPKGLA